MLTSQKKITGPQHMFLFVGEGVFFAGNAMINSGLRTLLELMIHQPKFSGNCWSWFPQKTYPTFTRTKFNIAPKKMMVGRLLSFWKDNFFRDYVELQVGKGKGNRHIWSVSYRTPTQWMNY